MGQHKNKFYEDKYISNVNSSLRGSDAFWRLL